MSTLKDKISYSVNNDGNAVLLYSDSGEVVTRIDNQAIGYKIYPIGSKLSTLYEHPTGIIIKLDEAIQLGLLSSNN